MGHCAEFPREITGWARLNIEAVARGRALALGHAGDGAAGQQSYVTLSNINAIHLSHDVRSCRNDFRQCTDAAGRSNSMAIGGLGREDKTKS